MLLFICFIFFSLAVGLPSALTEVLVSLTTKKKLSSVHVSCHGVDRDANWVGAQLIPFNFHVKLQEYIKSSNSVNGTLIQLLTSKECKIIVLFSLKVQTCVPAIHVCMGQRAPTFWMVTLAHARHILQAHDAKFLSVSRLIHRSKLLQLSLERDRLNYHAFVELYITRVRLAAYFSRKHWCVGTRQLREDSQ